MQKTDTFCIDESGWIHCPVCHCRTRTKIKKETVVYNFPVFCPKCKKEFLVDIIESDIKLSVEP